MSSIFQFSNDHWNVSLSQRHFLSFASKDNNDVVIVNLQHEVGLKIEGNPTATDKAVLVFADCHFGFNGRFFGEFEIADLKALVNILIQ